MNQIYLQCNFEDSQQAQCVLIGHGKRIQYNTLMNKQWPIIPYGNFDLQITSGAHQNKKTYVGPRQSLDIEIPGRRRVVIGNTYNIEPRIVR